MPLKKVKTTGPFARTKQPNKQRKQPVKLKCDKESSTSMERGSCVTCHTCIQPIVEATEQEDGQDALMCEGKCNCWYHCWCVGVSNIRYALLLDSEQPFLCPSCMFEVHE